MRAQKKLGSCWQRGAAGQVTKGSVFLIRVRVPDQVPAPGDGHRGGGDLDRRHDHRHVEGDGETVLHRRQVEVGCGR